MPIRRVNRKKPTRLRTERLAEISRRVREESMRVNAEFAVVEGDPAPTRVPASSRCPATSPSPTAMP
ncbi:hypothetical protein SBA4_330029 [Candidatus Sulfopaludibacter sp. SbA4]|nr:hypothetical protein SBA4_330029 [Candidatus Sulfopaludibacter sp. SbA4]